MRRPRAHARKANHSEKKSETTCHPTSLIVGYRNHEGVRQYQPTRPPPPDTAAENAWFASALADSARSNHLRKDWIKLLGEEMPLSEAQRDHLSQIPAKDAAELQAAIASVVDHGATVHFERESQRSPGKLIVKPKAKDAAKPAEKLEPAFSIGIFHCTCDANCRNWHCHWGPGLLE
jgi:hypothetical protein